MLLDRAYQREVLEKAAAAYPDRVPWPDAFGVDERAEVNILYLTEHGLGTSEWHGKKAVGLKPMWVRATAKGLDFLQDDGGLTAVLGVVTVRLHDDELKQLIIRRIEAAAGDTTTKERLKEAVKKLPADALNLVVGRVIDAGLDHLSNGLGAIGDLIGG